MLHTNVAELRLLCDTFTRVWSAGGQANLSLQTKDSQMWAKLDLQLGPADGHRPGPPVSGERARAHSDPEQEDQEVLPIAKCPNPTMVVETDKEIPDDNSDVIPQLDGPAEKASDTIVTLELNDIGDITGPELAPNSSPPARVFHPKAGIGILYGEPPDPTDKDSFYSYVFPEDPNAFVLKQGPARGQKIKSIMEVFECN